MKEFFKVLKEAPRTDLVLGSILFIANFALLFISIAIFG